MVLMWVWQCVTKLNTARESKHNLYSRARHEIRSSSSFYRIIVCIVVFHLVMIGIFGLKDMVAIPSLLIPLPIFAIIFQIYMQRQSCHATTFLSDVIADALPEGSPTVLQVILRFVMREGYPCRCDGLNREALPERVTFSR